MRKREQDMIPSEQGGLTLKVRVPLTGASNSLNNLNNSGANRPGVQVEAIKGNHLILRRRRKTLKSSLRSKVSFSKGRLKILSRK
jgi:hypothetical protein